MNHVRQTLHNNLLLLQNRRTIPRAIHQIRKMELQRLLIAALVHVLQDLKDDARVALCVQVDFLVVGDLPDLTVRGLVVWLVLGRGALCGSVLCCAAGCGGAEMRGGKNEPCVGEVGGEGCGEGAAVEGRFGEGHGSWDWVCVLWTS